MAESHVITALLRKRAELAGDIENAHEALRKMVLEHQPKAFRPSEGRE